MMPLLSVVAVVATAMLLAMLLSWLLARLVSRSGLAPVDHPGPRSSHDRPIPRGGGLGIVVVGLIALPSLAWAGAWPMPWLPAWAALAAVAGIGLLDDLRHRPPWLRLLIHVLAAALFAGAVMAASPALASPDTALMAAVVLALVWSINLHNFMDGIDGLLGLQGLWFGLVTATVLLLAGDTGTGLFALLLAAAALGFLPLNLPRARVFLGDGAAGFLGLAFGAIALQGAWSGLMPLPLSLIAGSAFLVDSAATLVARALRGQPVWRPHREHLYQLLVRSGRSHARVSGFYMLWNLLVALPALLVARQRDTDAERWIVMLATALVGLCVWWLARRLLATGPAVAMPR